MSAKKKLDLDISAMCCLRCTIDTRDKQSVRNIYSSEFRFQGGGWKLYYIYYPDMCQYNLYLWRCSGVSPHPFHVSVQVESSGTGRIAPDLTEVRRFTNEVLLSLHQLIWRKREEEIVRAVPEFRLSGVLKLVVVLKLGGDDTPACPLCLSSPAANQIKSPGSVPCLESLSQDFSKMLDAGSDPDVKFKCKGQSTGAHAAIVCARSPVIASMLTGDWAEGRTRVVNVPNMEPDVFRHFLRYLYTGTLPELTTELALTLYECGDRYAVPGLTRRCCQYLVEHLSPENACDSLVTADARGNAEFKEAVIDFMVKQKVPQVFSGWPKFWKSNSTLAIEVLNRICNAVAE